MKHMIHGLGSTHHAFLLRGYFAILYHMNDIIPLEGFFVLHHVLIEDNHVHHLDHLKKRRQSKCRRHLYRHGQLESHDYSRSRRGSSTL